MDLRHHDTRILIDTLCDFIEKITPKNRTSSLVRLFNTTETWTQMLPTFGSDLCDHNNLRKTTGVDARASALFICLRRIVRECSRTFFEVITMLTESNYTMYLLQCKGMFESIWLQIIINLECDYQINNNNTNRLYSTGGELTVISDSEVIQQYKKMFTIIYNTYINNNYLKYFQLNSHKWLFYNKFMVLFFFFFTFKKIFLKHWIFFFWIIYLNYRTLRVWHQAVSLVIIVDIYIIYLPLALSNSIRILSLLSLLLY